MLQGTHCDLSIALHDADLDILRASLHNLKQTLHGQFDGVVSREIVFVVLLEELADGLR